MIEIFAVVGFVVVLYLAYLFFRFSNFKSKLMNEFGRRGIPYNIADDVYYHAGSLINSMHADGKNVQDIVDEVFYRYPEFFK